MEQENKNNFSERHGKSISTSSPSEDSSSTSSVSMPTSPDGGYGWVIVFSAFLTSLICDGISYSLGILYTRLLEVFQESKSVTSWIPSLFYGASLMGGPLAGALVTKYGCRKVAIFGGLISSIGMVASSFADTVGMLCFTFGIIAGLGISMEYVTSVVMVAFYFEKKRALATGLSVCGTGIGTFVFAPLLKALMDEYDWRGSLLIMGGISANLMVCGALLRPLEFTAEEKYLNNLEVFEKISRTLSKASLPDHSTNRSRQVSHSGELDEDPTMDDNEHFSHSQIQLPTYHKNQTGHIPEKLLISARRNGSNLQQLVQKYLNSLGGSKNTQNNLITEKQFVTVVSEESIFVDESEEFLNEDNQTNDNVRSKRKKSKKRKSNQIPKSEHNLPLYKKDLFYRGNLMKVNQFSLASTSCPELNVGSFDDDDDDSSDDEDEDDFCVPKLLRLSKSMKKLFKTMFDLSILCNPVFVIFLLSNFLLYFWIDVPYVFTVDRAIEIGIADFWASFFVSVIGILNTMGQIVYGFIGDTSMNQTLLYGISISLCGVSVLLVPQFMEFVPLAVLSGGFGLFISANYVLSTVILVEFLGMDKLTNAYGLTMLMQGVANMIGPPVAGTLYDVSGNYDNTFYVGGAVIALSGCLLVCVPLLKCLIKIRRRQQLMDRLNKDSTYIHMQINNHINPEIGTAV